MRSLFWRIFASFWLALLLVAGLSLLLGRLINQDALVLARHPALKDFPERWVKVYQTKGAEAAQRFLERRKHRHAIDTQVLDSNGEALVRGTLPPRAERIEARHPDRHLPWRRLTQEYQSADGEQWLFIYRIPHPILASWQRDSLLLPVSALLVALLVLSLLSLHLTHFITRPLRRLRTAVHDLGQTSYQQHSLARLAARKDEFGVLAGDFNRMGSRLQDLIGSQRQLLRDVSHELRSPLARLRIALALAQRAEATQREQLWPRLELECDRLEALIGEILALARLDADSGPAQPVDLPALLDGLHKDAALAAPEQRIELQLEHPLPELLGWSDMLARAIDNLLRNALRFNPAGQPIELRVRPHNDRLLISLRDHGPGVPDECLERLGEPFFRAPGQGSPGHGLGLAIARRSAERHGGQLRLGNHPDGGFVAELELPLRRQP